VQTKSLADTYSAKTDEELIALATDPDSLLEEARTVLADELRRRNIAVMKSSDPQKTSAPRNTAINKSLRFLGAFALNLAIAIFGTTAVESPIWSPWSQFGRAHSAHGIEAREWFLGLTIAALLGFFIGRRRTTTAIWVWTLPLAFFALGALMYTGRSSSSVLVGGGFAEHFFAPNCLADPHDCRDFFTFTVPASRAVAYSLAARLSLHFQSTSWILGNW
jgi:hypothetical protein